MGFQFTHTMTDKIDRAQAVLEGKCPECLKKLPEHHKNCPQHPFKEIMQKFCDVIDAISECKDAIQDIRKDKHTGKDKDV